MGWPIAAHVYRLVGLQETQGPTPTWPSWHPDLWKHFPAVKNPVGEQPLPLPLHARYGDANVFMLDIFSIAQIH